MVLLKTPEGMRNLTYIGRVERGHRYLGFAGEQIAEIFVSTDDVEQKLSEGLFTELRVMKGLSHEMDVRYETLKSEIKGI